jgi:hypothetical protein
MPDRTSVEEPLFIPLKNHQIMSALPQALKDIRYESKEERGLGSKLHAPRSSKQLDLKNATLLPAAQLMMTDMSKSSKGSTSSSQTRRYPNSR